MSDKQPMSHEQQQQQKSQPQVPAQRPKPSSYWTSDVEFTRTSSVPVLLLLSVAAGCIDVFSVPALRVFVANNTGNLVFLGLAATQMAAIVPTEIFPIAAITSLAGSWFGSFASGWIGYHVGRKRRSYVIADFTIQSLLVFLVAGLCYGNVVQFNDGRTEYVAIALLSFSMGCQNVTVKGLGGAPTIPTQVATGAMADFFSDPKLFALANRARDERIIFVFTFFIGGLLGGFSYRYSSPSLALLMVAVFKLLAAMSVFWFARPRPQVSAVSA